MSAYVATEDVSTLSRRKSNLFPREVRKVLWNYLSLRLLGLLVLIGFSLIFVVAKLAWVNVFLWVSGLIVGWMVFEIDYLLRFVFYNSNENNAMAKNDLIRVQGKLF